MRKTIFSVCGLSAISLSLTANLASANSIADLKKPLSTPLNITAVNSKNAIADEYIVIFKDDAPLAVIDAFENKINRKNGKDSSPLKRFSQVLGFAGKIASKELNQLRNHPDVKRIEANQIVDLPPQLPLPKTYTSNITRVAGAWGVDRIDQYQLPLDNVYSSDGDGSGVHAYIIGTGIHLTHNDFGGRAVWDFTASNVTDGNADGNGHGTHVAGIVGSASYGVATDVTLHSVKVLNNSGTGTTAGLIEGIEYVTNNHVAPAVAVIGFNTGFSQSLNDAVAASVAAGVTYAVPSGDYSNNACNYSPGSVPTTITVAATWDDDRASGYSNKGECVDIYAPGLYIKSLWHSTNNANNTLSHSPMAAAHVAGAAAIIRGKDASCTPTQVKAQLLEMSHNQVLTQVPANTVNKLVAVPTISNTFSSCAPLNTGEVVHHVVQVPSNSSVDISFIPSGQNLTAQNGTLVDNGNNSTWTYTPTPGFSGIDSFDYTENGVTNSVRVEVGLAGNGQTSQLAAGTDYHEGMHIAALPDGRSVAVWSEKNNTDAAMQIYMQRFDTQGGLDGAKVKLVASNHDQSNPRIAVTADGAISFIVAFEENDDVFAHPVDIAMNPTGFKRQLNTNPQGIQDTPDIAVLTNGQYVTTYVDQQTGNAMANIYQWNGSLAKSDIMLFPGASDRQSKTTVTALEDGGFVVAGLIDNNEQSLTRTVVVTQRFNSSAQAVGSINYVTAVDYHGDTYRQVSVSALDATQYIVGWSSNAHYKGFSTGAWARIFNTNGTPASNIFEVNAPVNVHVEPNEYHQSVRFAKVRDSDFMAVWHARKDGESFKVLARQFDKTGVAVGNEFVVPVNPSVPFSAADITALPDGRLGVAYGRNGQLHVSWLTPGTKNNDLLQAGNGDNVIVGNGGNDEVLFEDFANQYSVTNNPDGSITVVDNRPGSPQGTNVLWDVEIVIFKQ